MLGDRDRAILRFIWRWKVVSSAALARKFQPNGNAFTLYRRLLTLRNSGYIESLWIGEARGAVWGLGAKGFKDIRPYLLYYESNGFKSENYRHDHLVSAFHLGEWLVNQPEYTQTFTEQQLRRLPSEVWDDWVPKSTTHRPDGYSLYFEDDKAVVVAFEAELSFKEPARYERVVAFYDSEPTIKMVFWLVESKAIFNSIRRAFEKCQVRDWPKHQFVLLNDFRKLGWMAQFFEGKFRGRTVSEFLLHSPHTKPTQSMNYCDVIHLLDTRKRPIKTTASNKQSSTLQPY